MALNRSRKIQVSANSAESTYDSAQTIDTLITVDNASMPSPVIEAIDDSDHVGGTEEATDQEIISKSMTMSLSQTRCKPNTLAFVAGYGLGTVAAADPQTNGYNHKITPKTAQALPSFTMDSLYETTGPVNSRYTGCIVNGFTFSVDRGSNRYANITADIIGSGSFSNVADAGTSEPSENGINLGATTGVWISTGEYDDVGGKPANLTAGAEGTSDLLATTTDLTTSLRQFTWNFSNNIDPQELYLIGGGLAISSSDRTARTQSIEFTLDVENDTYLTGLTDETDYSFQILSVGELIGGTMYHGMNLIFPKIRFSNISFQEQNGKVVQVITARVLEHADDGSVLLDIFNNVSAGYAQ